jgi:ankyrin repeat protein
VGAAAGATAPLCPYGADRRWEIEAAHEEQLSPAAAAQPHTRPGGFAHRATIACRGCSDDRCGGRGKRARPGYYSGAAARAVQAAVCASVRETGDAASVVPAVVAEAGTQAAWDWYDQRAAEQADAADAATKAADAAAAAASAADAAACVEWLENGRPAEGPDYSSPACTKPDRSFSSGRVRAGRRLPALRRRDLEEPVGGYAPMSPSWHEAERRKLREWELKRLITCAGRGNTAAVAQLLGGGTDVDVRNRVGETALMYAASAGHAEVVTQLLAARASVDVQAEDHMQFKDGSTALIKAVQGLQYRHRVGCAEVVTLLLAGKASVDVKNGEGDTALLKAVALGHVDAVTQLLDGGACVDVRDRRGCSVLHVAAVHAVMQYPASIVCYTGVVTGLLGAGASVDVTDRHGRTALMALITKSYDGEDDAYLADVVMRLLAAGASVDVVDKRGITMLYQSACKGHTTLMTRLLGGGASVDTRTKGGGTALFAAASQGHAAAVTLLLSSGASVNAERTLFESG